MTKLTFTITPELAVREGAFPDLGTVVSGPADLAYLDTKALLTIYNGTKKVPATKFASRTVALEQTWRCLPGASITTALTEATMATKTPKASKARTKYDQAGKIHVLADGNPRREGSAAHARFAQYRDGMLVKTALGKDGVTISGIRKDARKGYIKVVASE